MLVCFASVMHLLWGALVLLHGETIPIAATSVMVELIPNPLTRSLVYIVAAVLPSVLLWRPGSLLGLISVLPQEGILICSGISAIVAISGQHYADGVVRPWTFIAMDQGIYIVLAVLYAFESIDRYAERPSRP